MSDCCSLFRLDLLPQTVYYSLVSVLSSSLRCLTVLPSVVTDGFENVDPLHPFGTRRLI